MTYSASSTYATVDDLKNRLTAQGYKNIADRDADGFTEAASVTAIESAIEEANQIIDGYVQSRVDPDTARASGNDWLRDRCKDIAVYKAVTLGGRNAAESVLVAHDEALKMLREVASGRMQIPRMTYDYETAAGSRTQRVPRTFNYGSRTGRRR